MHTVVFPNPLSLALQETDREFTLASQTAKTLLTFYGRSAAGIVRELKDQVARFTDAEYSDEPEGKLPYLITHKHGIFQLFEYTEANLVGQLSDFEPNSEFIEQLKFAHAEAEKFRALAESVTLVHLALEEHLVSFCRGYTFNQQIKNQAFFTPLADLRDEYFTKPAPHLLEAYIAMVETMLSKHSDDASDKSMFGREARREAREMASERLVMLEVAIMLDELEAPTQDNDFSMMNG